MTSRKGIKIAYHNSCHLFSRYTW